MPDDPWGTAVQLFTGYTMPERASLFEKEKGTDGKSYMMTVTVQNLGRITPLDMPGEWGRNTGGHSWTLYSFRGNGKNGLDLNRISIDLLWDPDRQPARPGTPLNQYILGPRTALMGLVYNRTTQGVSFDGVSVGDANAVVLESFSQAAGAWDRAAADFTYLADVLKDWVDGLGHEGAAWRGEAAGAFRGVLDQHRSNNESYHDQIAPAGAGGTPALFPVFGRSGSITKQGDALVKAQVALHDSATDMLAAWDQWGANPGSNPMGVLDRLIQQIATNLHDLNMSQVQQEVTTAVDSGKVVRNAVIPKPGFWQDMPEFGDMSNVDNWVKVGQEAVNQWLGLVDSMLGSQGRQSTSDVNNAFIQASSALSAPINAPATNVGTGDNGTKDGTKNGTNLPNLDDIKGPDTGTDSGADGPNLDAAGADGPDTTTTTADLDSALNGADGPNSGLSDIGATASPDTGATANPDTGTTTTTQDLASALDSAGLDGSSIGASTGADAAASAGPETSGLFPTSAAATDKNGNATVTKTAGISMPPLSTGLATTGSSGKTAGTNNPDGSTTVTYPDGSTVTTYPDGSTVTIDADGTQTSASAGTVTTYSPDGTETLRRPDGSISVTTPDGITTVTAADRSVTTVQPDGSSVTRYRDGSSTVTTADGTSTHITDSGKITAPVEAPPLNSGSSTSSVLDTVNGGSLTGGASVSGAAGALAGSTGGVDPTAALPSYGEDFYDTSTDFGAYGTGFVDTGTSTALGYNPAAAAAASHLSGMGGMGMGMGGAGSAAAALGGDRMREAVPDPVATARSTQAPNGSSMPYMPGGGQGSGQGTESKDRERANWIDEDEDVWGTETVGNPAVIGRAEQATAAQQQRYTGG
ncbi:AAWKG family protein [Streptomyces sp. TLI_171]|uniref:AAWKG family protein n=1 Tax=Streptomyces sp. TLI_171 TaxID=1938859 RepID=UPI000E718355|nr:AAWKG family protein [Streptomyces sp. TLI_171]RKE22126.1 hypothetical protein BX266_5553 [Streptomyces sp. TLI_171]